MRIGREIVRRWGRYAGVNALGTIVDTSVLWAFSEFVFRGFESRYIIAPIISFECAIVNNFLFSYCWIWKEQVAGNARDMGARFAAYNLTTFLVFLVRLALLASIGSLTGWHPIVCNLIALLGTGVLNFAVQNGAVFSPGFDPQKILHVTARGSVPMVAKQSRFP